MLTSRTRARRVLANALAMGALVACVLASVQPVSAENVVVSMQVPSHTSLVDQCASPAAYRFGTTQPSSSYISATGADVCRFSFTSSNDTTMLRIRQADGTGAAMANTQAPTTIRRGARMGAVEAPTATTAYAVEYQRSGFYVTSDAGVTWTPRAEIPINTGNYTSMSTIGTSTILITRQFGTITRSTDSGATWSSISTPNSVTSTGLYGIASPSANAAYAVGDNGTIIKSTDAGASWSALPSPITGVRINEVAAPDDLTVFAVTSDGRLLRSTDGGANWIVSTLAVDDLDGVSAPDPNTVWISGDGSVVLRSTDGGATFPPITQPTGMYSGYSIGALDASTAYVGGTGTTYKTTDGGATWDPLPAASEAIVIDIAVPTASTAYLGMHAQTVSVTNDGGATWAQPVLEGADIYGVWGDGRSHHVVVGTYGRIERTTNDGGTWTAVASGTSATLYDVELDGDHGWAGGEMHDDSGVVVGTSDGGLTWNVQDPGFPAPDKVDGVAALEHGNAVAVGDAGRIATTSNGGDAWTVRTSGTASNLNDAGGHGDFVVAVGNGGTVLTSTDKGVNWTVRVSGTTKTLEAVSVFDEDIAWVAGDDGTVLRTDDGGVTWDSVGSNSSSDDFDAISAPSRDVAWAVRGTWGSTTDWHRTTDAGATWVRGGTTSVAPRAAYAVDGEKLISAGMNGSVVRTQPTVELPDYASATTNWASSGGMFGACLQAVGGGAATADWALDSGGVAGLCEANDADTWHAVPVAPARLATAAAAVSGQVDLVWGVRVPSAAAPGTYTAGVEIELLAPAV